MLLTLLEIAAIPTAPANYSSAVDFTFLFIKMIAALIVACVAAAIVLRYAVPKLSFIKKAANDKHIKILSRTYVGPKQHLYLVKVDEKCILLGVTDHSINKLLDVELKKVDDEGQA